MDVCQQQFCFSVFQQLVLAAILSVFMWKSVFYFGVLQHCSGSFIVIFPLTTLLFQNHPLLAKIHIKI